MFTGGKARNATVVQLHPSSQHPDHQRHGWDVPTSRLRQIAGIHDAQRAEELKHSVKHGWGIRGIGDRNQPRQRGLLVF